MNTVMTRNARACLRLLGVMLAFSFAGLPASAWAYDLSQCAVEVEDAEYAGFPVRPKLSVVCNGKTLMHGSDYLLAWRHNVNAGIAWVTVTATGKHSGRKTAFFTISRAKTSKVKIEGLEKSYQCTGKAISPPVDVVFNGRVMKKGFDYSLSYEDNTMAGTARLRVHGMRNLVGDKTAEFAIVPSKGGSENRSVAEKANIAQCDISKIKAQAFTGKAITPTPKVSYRGNSLAKGRDFTLSYKNNKNLGTASITIQGKGDYTGKKTVSFKIAGGAGARIAAAAVALAGGWSSDNRAPGPTSNGKGGWSDAQSAPPSKKSWRGQKWDWTLYKKVYAKVNKIRPGHRIHHACCDCLPVLAVLWAGVDDGYLDNRWPTVARERSYLDKSGKWTRVGGSDGYWHTNGGAGYGTGGVKSLQPGDILITLPNRHKHVMVYVGHDAAAKKWGRGTKVELVDEGYGCRWSNGKPMSSRGKCKWRVYRYTGSFNPSASKYAGIYGSELSKCLVL